MFERGVVHECIWYHATLGQWSIVDFLVVSSDSEESEGLGEDLSIILAEVTEVLKPRAIVRLSWLTRVIQRSGTSPVEWFPSIKSGNGACAPAIGYHTIQPPQESLLQGVGEKAPPDCRTTDSGRAVWLHVLCGFGES